MPSVRDLKGHVIEDDAAPVLVRGMITKPVETPTVLPQAALDAKRRLEARSGGERPETAAPGPTPVPAPRGLPPDLDAALGDVDRALATLTTALAALAGAVTDFRAHTHAEAAKAARAQLREMLGGEDER